MFFLPFPITNTYKLPSLFALLLEKSSINILIYPINGTLLTISHNVWQIPEVVRVGTSIRSKSPTRWGNNLGGGRQAESRESASYARALAPSTAGVKDPEEHRVRYETSSCWILVLLFLLSWTLKISSSSIY